MIRREMAQTSCNLTRKLGRVRTMQPVDRRREGSLVRTAKFSNRGRILGFGLSLFCCFVVMEAGDAKESKKRPRENGGGPGS